MQFVFVIPPADEPRRRPLFGRRARCAAPPLPQGCSVSFEMIMKREREGERGRRRERVRERCTERERECMVAYGNIVREREREGWENGDLIESSGTIRDVS